MSDQNFIYDGIVIGNPPTWMMLYGNKLLLGIFILILILSCFISYNDVIHSEVTVTSSRPPVYISPKSTGLLSNINVKSGSNVEAGSVLAIVENPASSLDVMGLREKLSSPLYDTITDLSTLKLLFPMSMNLGEFQKSYIDFINSYQAFISFVSLEKGILRGRGLKSQVKSQRFALSNQDNLLSLSRRKLGLELENLENQKKLFARGVISRSELNDHEKVYLEAQKSVQDNYQSMALLEVESSRLNNLFSENKLDLMESSNSFVSGLKSSKQQLLNDIMLWENKYVMKSPIKGMVSTFDIWDEYQSVEVGDFIFTISPYDGGKVVGKLSVPISNSGRIKKGQRVLIKLENYPYREWGSLETSVAYISDVPKKGEESYYTVYTDMENLTTNFGKEIIFKQEMKGSGEIILDEVSLLSRIFYQFRTIWQ